MTSPFHPQANGAAERTNHTMKQVLRTIVLAKLQQPSVAVPANQSRAPIWLRLLNLVEITINKAPIADTELSPYYLNLGYHPQFFFDVPNFDEERLRDRRTSRLRTGSSSYGRTGPSFSGPSTTSGPEPRSSATASVRTTSFSWGRIS